MRRHADLHLIQRLASQVHAAIGRLAQQRLGLRGAAWTTFTMEQHHRQVVLTERMAALRGSPEVAPRRDVVAHEPRRRGLHEVCIGSRVRHVGLGADGSYEGKKKADEPVAHDRAFRRR